MRLPLTMLPSDATRLESSRSCGECNVCCILPKIHGEPFSMLPMDKPHYTLCHHLSKCGNGCSVYNDRPSVCREYQCLWRAGLIEGDERRRPDKLHVMFGMNSIRDRPCIDAWETHEGAFWHHPARGIIDAIAARTMLLLRYYGVPCSLVYRGTESLAQGRELSRLAREDPPKLARWIRTQVQMRGLENVDEMDLKNVLAEMESRAPTT